MLDFKDLGRFEKIAWSIPVDLDGKAFLIEHRKLGLGVFAQEKDKDEQKAERIVESIKRGVRVAEPFFKWKAEEAVRQSALNVRNVSDKLFRRYEYFRDSFHARAIEGQRQRVEEKDALNQRVFDFPYSVKNADRLSLSEKLSIFLYTRHLTEEISVLALAAVDAVFCVDGACLHSYYNFAADRHDGGEVS